MATAKKTVKINTSETLNSKDVSKRVSQLRKEATERYGQFSDHPGAASAKSNQRLVKQNKWSSPKQIAKYQKQEAKSAIKTEARALKAANKPTRASKNPDIKMTKRLAEANRGLGMKEPYATRNAAQLADRIISNRQPRIGGAGIAGAFGIKNK